MRETVTPGSEQTLLELAQACLAAAVGVRDQRADAARRAATAAAKRLLDLRPVEAEDADVDGSSRPADRLHDRNDARVGLR